MANTMGSQQAPLKGYLDDVADEPDPTVEPMNIL
jgi:hypothetical protein